MKKFNLTMTQEQYESERRFCDDEYGFYICMTQIHEDRKYKDAVDRLCEMGMIPERDALVLKGEVEING